MKKENRIVFRRGKKVILRPPTKLDIPNFVRWTNDPEITQYLSFSFPVFEKEEEKWIDNLADKKQTDIVLIIETIEGKPIGVIGLHKINTISGTAMTGAFIGEKSYWNKGYGSDAKMILLEFAFNELNLRKIQSGVIAFNKRSFAYSQKCGYKREAVFKKHIFKKGQYWDEIFLAVYKKDWLPIWEKYQKTGKI